MKLKKETLDILKNFSSINNSIYIRKTPDGVNKTKIRVSTPSKSLIADVELDEVFQIDAGIYDMTTFINLVSTIGIDKHDADFQDKFVMLYNEDKTTSARIAYADQSLFSEVAGTAQLPPPDVVFEISEEQLRNLDKFSSLLSLPHLRLESKNGKLVLSAVMGDKNKGANTNEFSIEICDTTLTNINALYDKSTFLFMSGSYKVSTSMQGISKFESLTNPSLVYYVPHISQ